MNPRLFDAPGPKGQRRIRVANVIGVLLVVAFFVWIVVGLYGRGQLAPAKWLPIFTLNTWQYFLLPGLVSTLKAAALSVLCASALGVIMGLGRSSHNRLIRAASTVFVELFRAIPVLIMMLFAYALLASSEYIDASNAPFMAVVLGLTLYNSSVMAELVRSGIAGLPKGQREAALAIGLTPSRSRIYIELPQAVAAMLPSFVSQLVIILKDTGLGYLVNYPELLRQARLLGSTEANLLPALIVAAIIFIIINNALAQFAKWLAKRGSNRAAGRMAQMPAQVSVPV
ncbi:amino acid ABC transporter permease [Changpingibacter yushuensis]|uniref:amino acid ABC transporter permease n=1 Tax=Changpingibacter yushuensis TaxID=2758440 RepID=UPI0015F4BDC2|nr:amino acid ABC transporter permease [Changpingibacter yushuensis]